jgi:hypothetical protein
MPQSATYRRLSGLFLLLVLGLFVGAKALHTLTEHHEHAAVPSCLAAKESGDVHIHSCENGVEDCDLCAFNLTVDAIPDYSLPVPPLGGFADLDQIAPSEPCVKTACDSIAPRGPPVL